MVKKYNLLIAIIVFIYQPDFTVVAGGITLKSATNFTITYLNIPERSDDAITGSAFADQIAGLDINDREKEVVKEILSGNVPSFSRKLRPIKTNQEIDTQKYELIFFTVCDYLAIGSDQDYLYIPMTPSTAQYLADRLNGTLPTKKMVDTIYNGAGIKLKPQPIPPSDKMTTVPVFKQHTDSIRQQIVQIGYDRTADSVLAGHKKDIIISNKIYSSDRNYDRVVIYGWHLSDNNPIQPVFNGHTAQYADYSHGVRLISNIALLNGDSTKVTDILQDAKLSILLSSEGIISKPYYPPSYIFPLIDNQSDSSQIGYGLKYNYPNPFNQSTTITYRIPKISAVDLSIFNVLGQKVITLVSKKQHAGDYKVVWDAKDFANGNYFYKLITGSFVQSRKMLLLK